MKKILHWLYGLTAWLRATPITAEMLTAEFAAMTDKQLMTINPAQLSSLAKPIWQTEVRKRRLSSSKS